MAVGRGGVLVWGVVLWVVFADIKWRVTCHRAFWQDGSFWDVFWAILSIGKDLSAQKHTAGFGVGWHGVHVGGGKWADSGVFYHTDDGCLGWRGGYDGGDVSGGGGEMVPMNVAFTINKKRAEFALFVICDLAVLQLPGSKTATQQHDSISACPCNTQTNQHGDFLPHHAIGRIKRQ